MFALYLFCAGNFGFYSNCSKCPQTIHRNLGAWLSLLANQWASTHSPGWLPWSVQIDCCEDQYSGITIEPCWLLTADTFAQVVDWNKTLPPPSQTVDARLSKGSWSSMKVNVKHLFSHSMCERLTPFIDCFWKIRWQDKEFDSVGFDNRARQVAALKCQGHWIVVASCKTTSILVLPQVPEFSTN